LSTLILKQFQAVAVGKVIGGDDQVERLGGKKLLGGLERLRRYERRRAFLGAERAQNRTGEGGIVLDQENTGIFSHLSVPTRVAASCRPARPLALSQKIARPGLNGCSRYALKED